MSAQYSSSVFAMAEFATEWENNTRNPFRASYSNNILHEPGCTTQCCLTQIDQVISSTNHSISTEPLITGETVEYILTPLPSENKFLYDTNSVFYEKVPDNSGFINRLEVNNAEAGIVYSEFSCKRTVERNEYPHFCSTRSEAQRITKHNSKGVVKRKRKRTVFTTEQIITMEGVFKKRPYVSRDERLVLTRKLNLSEKAIKVWFQNRRRTTETRDKDQSDSYHSDSTVEELMYDSQTSRLDYIESKINQNADENGFVTLDNETITELVTIIINTISLRVDITNTFETNSYEANNESYLMYEPISPDSLSEDNDVTIHHSNWEPSIPEESLQRLIDIQNVLYTSS